MAHDLSDELNSRLASIELLLMDCDGVLTDGRLYYSSDGEAIKAFDVKDGQGIALWHAAGLRSGIITGRPGLGIVERRAQELGIEFLRDSSVDKAADLRSIVELSGVDISKTAFIGDDIGDLEVIGLAGVSIAVADAVDVVKNNADLVTAAPGGRGAVREAIDLMLAARRA